MDMSITEAELSGIYLLLAVITPVIIYASYIIYKIDLELKEKRSKRARRFAGNLDHA